MNRSLLFFLTGWGLLAVIQATFTDLAHDEAYYWMYSLHPDWGYFDHPPVTGLFIKAGYFLIASEAGVRLMTIISQIIGLYLIARYLLPEGTTLKNYYWLVVLIPLIHVFSFISFPDPPLLLATVIFLVIYKKFSESPSWSLVPWLAMTMAFMMYSKYHAALVIMLTMASSPKLFRDIRFMSACILGAAIFSPHLWWQYTHDFPSLKFHLVDRNTSFEIKDVAMYLVNQLINFNPVLFLLVLIRLIQAKTSANDFERALRLNFFGFLGFFLLMTWRGHIEPQWTYVLVVPLLYFGIKLFSERDFNLVIKSAFVVLPLIAIGRVLLIFNWLPFPTEFHGYPELAKQIQAAAAGKPVVIMNSYQLTAKYHFYSGEKPFAMITDGRRNQYSLMRDEEEILGKEAMLVSRREAGGFSKINENSFYPTWVKPVQRFSYYKGVEVEAPKKINLVQKEQGITLEIKNPYKTDLIFDETRELVLIILNNRKAGTMIPIQTKSTYFKGKSVTTIEATLHLSEIKTPAQAIIGIRSRDQFFSFNSEPISLILGDD